MVRSRGPAAVLCAGILLTAAAMLPGCATAEDRAPMTDSQRQLALESFDRVWETVRDKHFDPGLGGLDWAAIRDEMRPRIEHASTMREARAVMSEMLERLGQSHFAVIPREVYDAIGLPTERGDFDGVTGLTVRVVDDVALVVKVDAGSPAERAGIGAGFAIIQIGAEDLAPRLETIAAEYRDSRYKDAVLASAVDGRLRGPVDSVIRATFLDGEGREVSRELKLTAGKGNKYQIGFLPSVFVWIESRRLDHDIGYIGFNAFLDPPRVMPEFNAAIESFMNAAGVIIDLRGNGGGMPDMAIGMSRWLLAEKGLSLGTLYTREVELKMVVFPRLETYSGPVAILVDGLSGSCSELMAGGLQGLGRARIFGTTTMGAALASSIEKLSDGDGFQYAMANFISSGGQQLEGVGVVPDAPVALTREALLAGRDPQLEAAVAWIREQGRRPGAMAPGAATANELQRDPIAR